MRVLPYILLCLFALSGPACANAQNPEVWKKRVGRTIELAEKEDSINHKLVNPGSDSLLVQMLVSAVKKGKIIAYQPFDALFLNKIAPQDWEFPPSGDKVDTEQIIDPITGEKVVRIRMDDIHWNSWQKLRILEDWTFNTTTGRTEIQIVGIGPVRDIYGEAGDWRADQVGFWLKYSDTRKIIDHYECSHPNNTVTGHIWSDYFSDGNQLPFTNSSGNLTQYCTRLVELNGRSDSFNYLKDYNEDSLSSLFRMLFKPTTGKKLKVYQNCCDSLKPVPKRPGELMMEFGGGLDTVIVIDPISGEEVVRVRPDCDPTTNIFSIAEKWQFDANAGITKINIVSLGPVRKHYRFNSADGRYFGPYFWMRYPDIKPIIELFEQYNPENTLAQHIWNNYFHSDTKPAPAK